MEIDLTTMPSGVRYEDTYGKWLAIFKQIAEAPAEEKITVINPPACWIPLLVYLDCCIQGGQKYFKHDEFLGDYVETGVVDSGTTDWGRCDRTYFEVLCGFRPELVDALWKVDNQWKSTHVRQLSLEKEFIVTNNGSFFRPEVLAYLDKLHNYWPTKKKVCLVPCAADKPPPTGVQQAVLDILPDDYYLMIGTGVCGLVPQDLWPEMPWYDSGIPNQWRLMCEVRDYFCRTQHDRVVVYHDFYSEAIYYGLYHSRWLKSVFINPVQPYDDYINLLDPALLSTLRTELI